MHGILLVDRMCIRRLVQSLFQEEARFVSRFVSFRFSSSIIRAALTWTLMNQNRSEDDYDLKEFKLITQPPVLPFATADSDASDLVKERAAAQEHAVRLYPPIFSLLYLNMINQS